VEVSRICGLIRQVNISKFQWCAEHRLLTFWVIILVGLLSISIPLRNALLDFAFTIHDTDVKSNLKNAAIAQEVYFADHGTYASDIGSLKGYGYNQSFKVTLTASVTSTTFVIIGTTTKGCKANTGTWHFISTTGAISGTPCSRSR